MKISPIAIALAPLLAFGSAGAQAPITEHEVRDLLLAEGFSHVDDVDYEESRGLWEAEVTTRDGTEIEVHVDPVSSRVLLGDGTPYVAGRPLPARPATALPAPIIVQLPAQPLDSTSVHDILANAGFHDVHDVEFDDGRWRAEARDATGEDYEIELDPIDGRIVHVEDD